MRTIILVLLLGLLFLPACGSRKRYVINKALDSSGTRFMGDVEVTPDVRNAEIEVTDHQYVFEEVQLKCGQNVRIYDVVIHFESGATQEIDGENEFTKDEPHWEMTIEETDSPIFRVTFSLDAEGIAQEEVLIKLYGFVEKE